MAENKFIGIFIIIFGAFLFFGLGHQIYFLLDNSPYEYEIYSGNSNLTYIDFNFSKNYISDYYDISNGQKVYKAYVNVYIDEFLDNTSVESIPVFTLNNQVFQPINKSYEYSLQLEDDSLKTFYQNLSINQSGSLAINKVSLSYFGLNYNHFDEIETLIAIVSLLVIIIGILALL